MQTNQELTVDFQPVQAQPKQQDVQKQSVTASQEQIPDHFYDSDLASVNQKDFLSDNQPPKDQIQQRKRLYKQKMTHVFKTIIRLGQTINKPARFDRINLKFKAVPLKQVVPRPLYNKDHKQQPVQDHPPYFSSLYLMDVEQVQYNLGKEYEDIERLVTSMKKGQVAVFEIQHLQTSKKSNIKVRRKVEAFVIGVRDWTTVIDLDCDGKFLKEVVRKGEGHSRISKHDEASFRFTLTQGSRIALTQNYQEPVKLEDQYLESVPAVLWKLMNSMKTKEWIRTTITDEVMRQIQGENYIRLVKEQAPGKQDQTKNKQNQASNKQVEPSSTQNWLIEIQVFFFHSIDNILLDGRLLKKLITRGVSTAKPDPSSLVYFALRFQDSHRQLLHQDPCFNSDWWQDPSKLDLLGCRKHYLDDYSVSDMLRQVIQRMKPAEVAQIQCREPSFFTYGTDYEEYRTLTGNQPIPQTIFMGIRVYNFIQGRNCFNMELDEKVAEARRKKAIGIVDLNRGDFRKAVQTFQIIISFFSSGLIDQQAYDQKVSALMNCSLCHFKTQNFALVLNFCNQVLQVPRHGYDPAKIKINGPGRAKIEGKLPQSPQGDQREEALLTQNPKIMDKCLYRKAFALVKLGEGALALQTLKLIQVPTEETQALEQQAQKSKSNYEKKSVKMFKNMFG